MAGLSNWLSLTFKLAVKSIRLWWLAGDIWLFIWIWLIWLDHFREDCFDQKSTVDEENEMRKDENGKDDNGKDEDGNKKDGNDEDEDQNLWTKRTIGLCTSLIKC